MPIAKGRARRIRRVARRVAGADQTWAPLPEMAEPAAMLRPRCPRCQGRTYADVDLHLWRWHCIPCGWEGPDYRRPARFPKPERTSQR